MEGVTLGLEVEGLSEEDKMNIAMQLNRAKKSGKEMKFVSVETKRREKAARLASNRAKLFGVTRAQREKRAEEKRVWQEVLDQAKLAKKASEERKGVLLDVFGRSRVLALVNKKWRGKGEARRVAEAEAERQEAMARERQEAIARAKAALEEKELERKRLLEERRLRREGLLGRGGHENGRFVKSSGLRPFEENGNEGVYHSTTPRGALGRSCKSRTDKRHVGSPDRGRGAGAEGLPGGVTSPDLIRFQLPQHAKTAQGEPKPRTSVIKDIATP